MMIDFRRECRLPLKVTNDDYWRLYVQFENVQLVARSISLESKLRMSVERFIRFKNCYG